MTAAPPASAKAICAEESKRYHEIAALANDYARYLHDDGFLQAQQFDDSIEELLTKLDEYHSLLDMIRSDTSLCLQKNLPLIRAKTKDMEKIFDKIDKLEAFVAVVKKNMSVIEEKVSKAESELDTLHGFKKVLSAFPIPSFFASKPPAIKQALNYEAPNIFRTKDFITMSNKERTDNTPLTTECALAESLQECDNKQIGSPVCPTGSSSDCVTSSLKKNHNNQAEVQSTSQSNLSANKPEASFIQKDPCPPSDNKASPASETDIPVEDDHGMKTENMES